MIRVLIMDNFIYSISKKRKRTLSHIETGKRLDDENTAFEKRKKLIISRKFVAQEKCKKSSYFFVKCVLDRRVYAKRGNKLEWTIGITLTF